MTAVKLREWQGVKPVAHPAGVAIATRLQTTPDERVLDLVGELTSPCGVTVMVRLCYAGSTTRRRH